MMQRFSFLRLFFTGFVMGVADLVPGVSGGTIAFISGIYETLVHNISTVGSSLRKVLKNRDLNSILFLVAIFLGLICGIALFALPIKAALRDPDLKSLLYACFFGAVSGAAFSILYQNRFAFRPKILAVGFLLGLFFLLFQSKLTDGLRYDAPIKEQVLAGIAENPINWDRQARLLRGVSINELAYLYYHDLLESNIVYDHRSKQLIAIDDVWLDQNGSNGWAIFFHGLVASAAMILPGISGGYILVLLGSYAHVIHSIGVLLSNTFSLSIDMNNLIFLSRLGLGIISGLILFSKVIDRFFHKYHQSTLFLIVGFMMGTISFLWPFWSTQSKVVPTEILKIPVQQVFLSPIFPDIFSWMTWLSFVVFTLSMLATIMIDLKAKKIAALK